jgi:phage baseplate assembly protein gpV
MRGEFRTGRIDSTDAKTHTARVKFEEVDGFISWDLSVLVTRPGDYSMPAQGTEVLCVLLDGPTGHGWVLGAHYNDEDAPPTNDGARRVVAGDDVRLGAFDASDKVALAPAVKTEIQKALDYADGIVTAIKAGLPVAQDGGANLKATIVAALPVKPSLSEPAAENVSAK